jgi:hypothetical protein
MMGDREGRLTDADWKVALKKWERGEYHLGSCIMCSAFRECRDCVLNDNEIRQDVNATHCCSGLWRKWNEKKTEKNAAAVYDFIAKAYKSWKKKQK